MYSQSELLQKEVFLVEMIDSISVSKESMSHLKAVYFIRPTSDNIQKLRYQLANPRFGEYHLCMIFSSSNYFEFIIVHSQYTKFDVVFVMNSFSFLQSVEGYSDSYFG